MRRRAVLRERRSRRHPLHGAEGQSCATAACGRGYYCAASTKTCTAYPSAGQSCAETQFCADRSYCLGRTAPVCTAGTVAVGGTCKLYDDLRTASSASTLCASGLEQETACVPSANSSGTFTCQQVRASCF